MNKIINPGRSGLHEYFCRICIENGNLSITGVVGPRSNGNCYGSAGQTSDTELTLYHPGWTGFKYYTFQKIWKDWHLNDMTSYCEHIDLQAYYKTLEVEAFQESDKYHELREKVTRSRTYDPETYAELVRVNNILDKLNINKACKGRHLWDAEIQQAFEDDWFEVEHTCSKAACNTYPHEHPEGYLTRECLTCGYKQGTAWLKRELPAEVIEFLEALPESKRKPAWV